MVAGELRVYISKCVEMAKTAPKQQQEMGDKEGVQHVRVTAEQTE